MASSQFSFRISPELDTRIKQFAKENSVTKSKVLHDALAHYFGCVEEVPLISQIAEINQRLIAIESFIKNNYYA
jgi:predicted DNA-binding protein